MKNCKAALKCRECESDGHIGALHPGPPQWNMREKSSEHGREGEGKIPQPLVDCKCTEVCSVAKEPRSYSKICLMRIYPKAHPDKVNKVYAFLDDQSNRSLARSKFFNLFQISGSDSPYTLRTCAGVAEASRQRKCGLVGCIPLCLSLTSTMD